MALLLPRRPLLLLLLVAHAAAAASAVQASPPQLQLHFYARSCPRAESIVRRAVRRRATRDRSVLPALIRLHFHDCFVRGCDGSVLIDSTPGHAAEKDAAPNQTLRMLDVIDDAKAAAERSCPGVVSCADIVALAARDAAAMAGKVRYQLPTGRRDGTSSSAAEVNLPSPSATFADALAAFRAAGLGALDLAALLGAHTMGFCHCGLVAGRIYGGYSSSSNNNRTESGPAMDPGLLAALRRRCPPRNNASRDAVVPINFVAPLGPFGLDNALYPSVLAGRAVLQIDQELASDGVGRRIAAMFATRPGNFRRQFARSMVKLGNVNVLTGSQGEVRLNCRRFNS